MKGRTLRIYLVDGVPMGVLTAEIINWTGKVVVAPRSQLAALAKRDEVKRTGVYCLVGPDPDTPSKECVYVGEGDSVWTRLVSHDKDESKDFWNRVVFVISPKPDYYVFTEDVSFSSPSAGGAVVNAGNINGRTAWKIEGSGQTYQEWYDKKLADAASSTVDD